jgi:molybdopterin molybdotransferase
MAYTSVTDALARLFQASSPINDVEICSLHHCAGRTLAETLTTSSPIPRFDRAAMDGYAVQSRDLPGQLTVMGTIGAGDIPSLACQSGQAYRIFTGAPLPPGADAVVEQEQAMADNGLVRIGSRVKPGRNISPSGSEFAADTVVLGRGQRLGPIHVGLVATLGLNSVRVLRKPRVLLVTTGTELVLPGSHLPAAHIYDANRFVLTTWLEAAGAQVTALPIVPDIPGLFISELHQALAMVPGFDMVITTGGVSVGDKDDVIQSLRENSHLLFWRADMHPGKSIAGSVVDNVPVLSLSGNPGAAMTSWVMLGVPWLAYMHHGRIRQEIVFGCLTDGFPKATRETRYLRSRIIADKSGNMFDLSLPQQSDLLSSYAVADAFAIIPQGSPPIAPGTVITGLRTPGLGSTALSWDPSEKEEN